MNQLLSEAVVTTAGKRNQRLQDVPLTVAWIPAEELEGTGAFTLCEAIQYFPGLECRRGAMRKVAVSARGLGSNYLSNRLLLLKDGRPLTDPWTGQFYADETTPLTNLKQVEVIRGPGSVAVRLQRLQRRDQPHRAPALGPHRRRARTSASTAACWRARTTPSACRPRRPAAAARSRRWPATTASARTAPQLFNDPRVGRVDTNQDSLVHQVSGKVKVGTFSLDADFTDAELGRPGGHADLHRGQLRPLPLHRRTTTSTWRT